MICQSSRERPLLGGPTTRGGQYVDQANTEYVSAHTTYDAGVRYSTRLYGHNFIGRFSVTNLTDKDYWVGAFHLGNPRRYLFSVQADL